MSSSSASTITIKKVNDLKESLIKIITKQSNDDERILDILSNLDQIQIDVSILAATLIGATVSKLKSNTNENVKIKAKSLVKKWKQVAKESGVVATSSSSSSDVKSKNNSSSSAPADYSGTQSPQSSPSHKGTSNAATAKNPTPNPNMNTSSTTSESIQQFDHLPNFRKNSAMKLYDTFQLSQKILNDSPTPTTTIIIKSIQVEEAIQSYSNGNRKSYIDKIRSLLFNLKKNTDLRNSILLNTLSPSKLVTLSPQELQTTEKLKEQQEQVASLQGSRRLDWEQANAEKVNEMCGIKGDLLKASLFTCGRCKSHKTTSTQKQTRSADEPMTVFVFCENCGNRWKC